MSVRAGGGIPSEAFELAQHPGWRWFQFDSAKANLANATLERLSNIVGCYVHSGRLGEPDDRAFIERFFATLARFGLHQVPGTTGSSPQDPVRALGAATQLQRLMTVDELEQVIEVMLGDYNGEAHGGLGGRTPMEAMQYWLRRPGALFRQLPAWKRRHFVFLQEARIMTVVGGQPGVRPHVNFERVRYTSDVLASKPELCGKDLRVYFNIKDIRQLEAFFMDGAELGPLIAARSWRTTPHSLRQRREILRLAHLNQLHYREGEDAVEAYALYKRRQAASDKRAANALAKLGQAAAMAKQSQVHGQVAVAPASKRADSQTEAQPTQGTASGVVARLPSVPVADESAAPARAPALRPIPAGEKPREVPLRGAILFTGRKK
jgi:hypothetical protein